MMPSDLKMKELHRRLAVLRLRAEKARFHSDTMSLLFTQAFDLAGDMLDYHIETLPERTRNTTCTTYGAYKEPIL